MSVAIAPEAGAAPTTPAGATVAPVTAPPGNAPAGSTPPAQPGVPIGGSQTPTAPTGGDDKPWFATLTDEGNRKLAETKQWKTMDDALKSYAELQAAYSGKTEALAPKSADDYKFAEPENAKDIGYDPEFAKWFKGVAHKGKFTNEQASLIHDEFVRYAASASGAQSEALNKALETQLRDAETTLTKAWGAQDNPVFGRSLEMARRAIDQLGLGDVLAKAGVLVNGKIASADAVIALSKVGTNMFAEDAMFGAGSSGNANVNPFDPKTRNITAQSNIINGDPRKALTLIQSLPADDQKQYTMVVESLKQKVK